MKQNIVILIVGILLIFLSLFVFTRPALFESWDFTDTGQIGDTIGGISAPVINLVGAFLVYISFKEQIAANKIQSDALEDEKNKNKTYKELENHMVLFDEIRNTLNKQEFTVKIEPYANPDGSSSSPTIITYNGINALEEYVKRIEDTPNPFSEYYRQVYSTHGQYISFHFILSAILDLLNRIEFNVKNKENRDYLFDMVKRFYRIFLYDFSNRVIEAYSNENIEELIVTKNTIDSRILK